MPTPRLEARSATVAAAAAGGAWTWFAAVTYRPTGAGPGGVGCPVKLLTGLDCPGCGSTRALGALAHGDLGAALDHHLLVPVALAFVVSSWALWTWSTWMHRPVPTVVRGPVAIAAIAVVLVLFTVARNLGAGSWLGSGLT